MMNLPSRIKAYYLRYGFHRWKDMAWEELPLWFEHPDAENLLDISAFLSGNLAESPEAYNEKLRLKKATAVEFDSLDEVVSWLGTLLGEDYRQTLRESRDNNWNFRYFMDVHSGCSDTISLSVGLTSRDDDSDNCVYSIAHVRKNDGRFLGWSNLAPVQDSDGFLRKLR